MNISNNTVMAAMRALYNHGCAVDGREQSDAEFMAFVSDEEGSEFTAAMKLALEAGIEYEIAAGSLRHG